MANNGGSLHLWLLMSAHWSYLLMSAHQGSNARFHNKKKILTFEMTSLHYFENISVWILPNNKKGQAKVEIIIPYPEVFQQSSQDLKK